MIGQRSTWDALHHLELPDGHVLGRSTVNTSSNDAIIRELQSTLDPSRILLPAWRNLITCMVHRFQLAIGVVMSSLGVIGLTTPSGAAERNQQFGENDTIDFGKS